jgi:hypothetical protein
MKVQKASLRAEPEPLNVASEIPIACSPMVFPRERRAAHLALAIDAIVRWPRSKQELPDGFLFEYEGNEERFLELARWASAEHRCCPWAGYSVEMGPFSGDTPGMIRMRVRGTDEGKAFLKICFEYVDRLGGSSQPPDSLFESPIITRESVQQEIDRCDGGC